MSDWLFLIRYYQINHWTNMHVERTHTRKYALFTATCLLILTPCSFNYKSNYISIIFNLYKANVNDHFILKYLHNINNYLCNNLYFSLSLSLSFPFSGWNCFALAVPIRYPNHRALHHHRRSILLTISIDVSYHWLLGIHTNWTKAKLKAIHQIIQQLLVLQF